jgi:hypothetical protein
MSSTALLSSGQESEQLADELFRMTVTGETSSPLSKHGDVMWGRKTGPLPPKPPTLPSACASTKATPKATPQATPTQATPKATPTQATPAPELSPADEQYDNLVVLDYNLDIRYKEVIEISRKLPLPPGDQTGPGIVNSHSSWVRDTMRRLEVAPTFGVPRITMLVKSMHNRAREMDLFIEELRPQLGVAGPTAEERVIDTSELNML